MKCIAVTGGAGFIGSNFIFHMRSAHPDVRIVCLDSLTYAGNIETLSPLLKDPEFKFYKTDIRDRDSVFRVFRDERPDTVVNFAAESHVDRSIANPQIFLETNIIGTSVLMDACLKYEVNRFHQISTDEVYGAHIRAAGDDLKMFQQLRPLSVSGEADTADDQPCASRSEASCIRRWFECEGLASCQ